MSALGNHGRTRLTRIGITTALAASALALPLIGAASAHADQAPAAPHSFRTSADAVTVPTHAATPAAAPAAAAPAAAPATAAPATYKVVGGDSLSKIADAQHVDGGWHKLYDDNRTVVGGNPNLIFAGQQLTVGAKATPAAAPAPAKPATPAPAAAPQAAKPAKPAKPATTTVSYSTKASTQTAAKAAPAPAAVASTSGFTAPVANPHINEAYGVPGTMWASGHHTGVDFAASVGTSLRAVGNGTVVSAGNGGAYGNQIIIKLADGKYAQYAHLSSIGVSAGQSVTAGQQIGLSGATGNVTGPHLHFEIRTTPNYGSDIDPIAYLRAHSVNV
ncbi:M23 family metallopeptidase [Kitasatospora sp. McL0602]|uniref:M23 family metallopeptidase n=1 Tax=Kitasatospora sp. McL0602 TaxID=3439530 RepID=UPI003F8B449A